MKKQEFLDKLKGSLWAMPEADIRNSLEYYSEMIDDRMEDGLSEEAAVAAIGDLDEIVSQILGETPRPPQVVQKETPKKNPTPIWLIILLVLGFPVWGSIAIAIAAVIFSAWVSLWAVVISLYATAFALGVSALGCILGSFFMVGGFAEVIVAWGAALVCAGLAILLVMLSNLAAKGMVKLTKWIWNLVFRRKEQAV